ncbi:MAG: biotin transporter BioY [Phycisphaerales bacterium]|nr:biotin transporter BioY [Phycisphaerales bacterium]
MRSSTAHTLTATSAGPVAASALSVASAMRGGAVLAFVALTALAAQWQVWIPGRPVPFTFQSLAVLLCGMLLSPREALAATLLYLAAGSATLWTGWGGLNLFTPGSTGLAGPTGGYLVGFAMAAPLVSWLRLRTSGNMVGLVLAGLAGTVVVFAAGVSWLSFVVGGWEPAVAAGLLPFLPDALVKLIVAVGAAVGWRAIAARGSKS